MALSRTVIYSSASATNDAVTLTGDYLFVTTGGKQMKINGPMISAMGADYTGSGYSVVWDALNIGGRITQDVSDSGNKIYPMELTSVTHNSITTVDTSSETTAVQTIAANQVIIDNNLSTLIDAYNLLRVKLTYLTNYMGNYKMIKSWTDSGGS